MSVYLLDVEGDSQKILNLIRGGMHPSEAVALSRNESITLIREALKRRSGKAWSVTGGRGTDWGWLTIQAPPARRVSSDGTQQEGRNWYTSEADCAELARLLDLTRVDYQGVSIPAATDYRLEYVARALGLEPLEHGKPYWD